MRIDVKADKAITFYNLAIKGMEKLQNDLIIEMDNSGFKNLHFISKLNINSNTFYKKKRNLEFTVDEVNKIVEILSKK